MQIYIQSHCRSHCHWYLSWVFNDSLTCTLLKSCNLTRLDLSPLSAIYIFAVVPDLKIVLWASLFAKESALIVLLVFEINLSVLSSQSLVHLWPIYGPSLANLWPISGQFIAHFWPTYYSSLANLLPFSGQFNAHLWPIYCPSLANLLSISGQFTAHLWLDMSSVPDKEFTLICVVLSKEFNPPHWLKR